MIAGHVGLPTGADAVSEQIPGHSRFTVVFVSNYSCLQP
jgi:hypothetical protein